MLGSEPRRLIDAPGCNTVYKIESILNVSFSSERTRGTRGEKRDQEEANSKGEKIHKCWGRRRRAVTCSCDLCWFQWPAAAQPRGRIAPGRVGSCLDPPGLLHGSTVNSAAWPSVLSDDILVLLDFCDTCPQATWCQVHSIFNYSEYFIFKSVPLAIKQSETHSQNQ